MTLLGPDGQPVEQALVADPATLTDEQAEKLGENADFNAIDDLGVPFFYCDRYYGLTKKEPKPELYGQRLPERVRRQMRNEIRSRLRAEEIYMNKPMPRGEALAMFQNSIAPLGRQVQSTTFHTMALKRLLVARGIITNEDFDAMLSTVTLEYRTKATVEAAKEKGIPEEEITNALKAAELAPASVAEGADAEPPASA